MYHTDLETKPEKEHKEIIGYLFIIRYDPSDKQALNLPQMANFRASKSECSEPTELNRKIRKTKLS